MSKFYVVTDGTARGAKLAAVRPFISGEVVFNFLDAPVTVWKTYQTVQIGPQSHVLVDDCLVKLNHACDPNLIVDTGQRLVFARRNIQAGEELTFFYPSTEWDMAEPFKCRCGAPNCLQWIAGARYLSKETISRYFVNRHIIALMQRQQDQNKHRNWRFNYDAQSQFIASA